MNKAGGTAAVIVEMENLRKSDPRRAARLFAFLRDEVRTVDKTIELIVLHDPEEVRRDEVANLLAGARLYEGGEQPRVSIHAAPGQRYYELKNTGARLATSELVLFLDCDLEPEPGFLRAMLSAFDDPAVEVVAASPYVDPGTTVFEKAFALFWLFPLRPGGNELTPISEYAANSVAFRRELFLDMPFPPSPCYRRQCNMQARALIARGHVLWGNPAAPVRHPPPRTWRAAIDRALREGRDRYFDRTNAGQRPATNPVTAARGMRTSVTRLGDRIRTHAGRVGLKDSEVPAALAIAGTYELAVRAGFIATWIHPRIIPNR